MNFCYYHIIVIQLWFFNIRYDLVWLLYYNSYYVA